MAYLRRQTSGITKSTIKTPLITTKSHRIIYIYIGFWTQKIQSKMYSSLRNPPGGWHRRVGFDTFGAINRTETKTSTNVWAALGIVKHRSCAIIYVNQRMQDQEEEEWRMKRMNVLLYFSMSCGMCAVFAFRWALPVWSRRAYVFARRTEKGSWDGRMMNITMNNQKGWVTWIETYSTWLSEGRVEKKLRSNEVDWWPM